MDSYDIFKKLTTNLAFPKKVASKKTDLLVLQAPINKEVNQIAEPLKDFTNPKKRGIDENRDETSIKIVGNITSDDVSASRKKLKKEKKTTEKIIKIKKETENHIRNLNNIHVNGDDVPEPTETFDKLFSTFSIPGILQGNLLAYNFQEPTPIQMQAIPALLNNREIMACAPTGSGKTIAFLLPILYHLKKPEKKGFRALILAPTRELVQQTYTQCCQLSNGMGFRIHIINNANKALKKFNTKTSKKFDILITTPKRLEYLLKNEESKLNLSSVEWLIIDEADKLFEDGRQSFREQLSNIYKACDNPLIKHGMFSATLTNDVEDWCKSQLNNLIQISIGRKNLATYTVDQEIIYVGNEHGKLYSLRSLFKKGFEPPILVFVQSKDRAKQLFKELIYDGINVDVIHAERTQLQRDNTIRAFRQGKIWVLICTELMGRGIDFKGVNLVINYDFPLSAISYIHRIGRTGRAGRLGKAITLFTDDDLPYLRSIANVMKQAGCDVPDYMLKLKNPSKKLKRLREKKAPKRSKISTALKNGTFKHDKHDANVIDFNGNNTEETIEIESKATKEHVKNKRGKAINKGIAKKPRSAVSKELKKTKKI